jgi:hypothetical protein
MQEEVVKNLVLMQIQFKICHWQTEFDAQHRAFGDTYDKLGKLIDKFVEICMGKHERFSFDGGSTTLEIFNLGDMDITQFIDSCIGFLVSLSGLYDSAMDTDLLNLRDEMMGSLNKLKYLLTLKG